MEDVSIVGRKTFFIAPDRKLLPDSCLERLMSHGYESYVIANDGPCPMKKKVDDIIRLFPGCILYFNVDAKIPGIDWRSYIKDLSVRVRLGAKIGIAIGVRSSAEERYQLENYYHGEVKVSAGMLELSGDEADDYGLILEALARAGALGRRKIVRAEGDPSSTVTFPDRTARLKDISRTYFCCVFDEMPDAQVYDRFNGIMVKFNGMSFTSNAVLVMKHSRMGMNCGIFMFVKEDGSPELEPAQKEELNRRIYNMLTAGRKEAMERAFSSL